MPNHDPPGLRPSQAFSAPGPIVDWHGIIQVLWDKSWLIISCVVLALAAAAAYVKWTPRVYEAVATVQVEQEDPKVVKTEQVVSEDLHELDDLNTVSEKIYNAALLQQVLAANHLLPPEGTDLTNDLKTPAREKIIKQFARDVKTSLRRNTRLIDITVRNTDRRLAARLVNSLVDSIWHRMHFAQFTTTERANMFLQQEAERQKKKLEASEQALQDYRRRIGLVL